MSIHDPVDFPTFSGLIPGNARPTDWVELGDTLKALYRNEPAKSSILDEAAPPVNLAAQAIWCQDWDLPIDGFSDWKKLRTKLADKYPNTQWTAALNKSLQCTGYAGETTNPQAELDIDGAPPVMLGNVHDPLTVYPWTTTAADQSGASLITYEGFGHTIYAYGRPSDCINNAVDDYLIDLKVPDDGLRCPDVEKPGGTARTSESPTEDSF